jgi:hypothetical protein
MSAQCLKGLVDFGIQFESLVAIRFRMFGIAISWEPRLDINFSCRDTLMPKQMLDTLDWYVCAHHVSRALLLQVVHVENR